MSLSDEGFDSDFDEIIDDLPASFVWADGSQDGITVTRATISPLVLSKSNQIAGHFLDPNMQIAAQKSEFATVPQVGQGITVTLPAELAGDYRIQTFTKGEDEVSYNFIVERV